MKGLRLAFTASVLCASALLPGPGTAWAQQAKSGSGSSAAKAPAKPAASTPAAPSYAQRYAQVCAACHGANGRGEMQGVPALAGQPSFYAITQLFLFREGRRANEAMTAVAKTMTDDDMRGFSEFIGTLAPVPAPPLATPPDAARMARGKQLATEYKCVFCHGDDFSGGQQVPRVAQQREEYLATTLQEFKSGKRPGYSMAMSEALRPVPAADLDTLAYYLARFTPAAK
ncbi:MAG: c-type cytochrome [Proteobacteria bacterium]|nr:c-type cytochrome [Pseudomonadota bacterium]